MKRALISVYDKEGIVAFSKELKAMGWEIISTGGTFQTLKAAGVEVLNVESVTKFPEILEGRVKTLHPFIHGGLLYKRDDLNHVKTAKKMNIPSIDLVVNNLYPFEETVKRVGVTHEEIIENIDIGGPSMIRAAAKNYKDVTVLVDPKDYKEVLEELKASGDTDLKTRVYLAGKVFNYTAYYDALIAKYFNELQENYFPEILTLSYKKEQALRYGENPHQSAAFYTEFDELKGTLASGKQLHGKELSFNNINDANGALLTLKEFEEPTIVAVKHSNPCGVGSGKTLLEAYVKAYECDSESIFGGIIAANREIDLDVAIKISEIFIEVLLAPSFTKEAIEVLTKKKNIRLLEIKDIGFTTYKEFDMKKVLGGLLLQKRDDVLLLEDLKVVTTSSPTEEEMKDLLFAWKAAKNIKSNGVVIAKNSATIGIGLGEVNRFWAVESAIKRAKDQVDGSVLASDGFFPFKDSIEVLAEAGIRAIIQPGGSIRDGEVIEEANKHNMIMVFTGMRHFKH